MCIAILKKEGAEITDDILSTCYIKNSDGCGFAYIDNGSMVVSKTMDYEKFLEDFRKAETDNPESPFLIHFRIATHGTVDEFNCHPFKIDNDTAFIHNGVIPGMAIDAKRSDTQMFNDEYLKELPEGWRMNVAIKPLVEKFISMSKLVWLHVDGSWDILNESKGYWEGDIWYSNTGYKTISYGYNRYGGSYNSGRINRGNTSFTRTGGNGASASTFRKNTKDEKRGKDKNLRALPPVTVVDTEKEDVFGVDDFVPADGGTDLSAYTLDISEDFGDCLNCGVSEELLDMVAFEGSRGDELYCVECEAKLLAMGFLDVTDEIEIYRYVESYNEALLKTN